MNWNSPFWQGAVHTAKVIAFLFVSGGLTSLANNLGNLHMNPTVFIVVSGGVNSLLAWITKTYSVSMIKQAQPTVTVTGVS